MAVIGSPLESLLLSADDDELLAIAAVAALALPSASMAEPDGAIVTVEPVLIVNVFCKIWVAVRLAAFVPSPTVVLPA